jgi:VIT1/CCC1 family predicted Fe2+/Mn2+ transporter
MDTKLNPMGWVPTHELTRREKLRELISEVIHELIFGAEDGLVSILGAVIGVAISVHDNEFILLAGAAAALPGAISMAAGTYLGAKSEAEVLVRKMEEEREQFNRDPEGEHEEMREFYRQRGFNEEEIAVLMRGVMRNPEFLLEEMAAHELGIAQKELVHPLRRALWMYLAYVLGSAVPLLPFVLFDYSTAFTTSIVGTILALMGIGAAKTLVTHRPVWKSALEMLVVAMLAGGFGFLVGQFFLSLAGQ